MVSVLEVIVKDEQRRLKRDFLIYEKYEIDEEDPTIKQCIKETIDEFKGKPDNVKLRVKMEIE